MDHSWLLRVVRHRVGDERIARLVGTWLKAGVLEDGQWRASEQVTPQGAVISPLLANACLHDVFDLWAHAFGPGEDQGRDAARRHDRLSDQGQWLRSVVAGCFAYHAVPTNVQAIGVYRHHVLYLWRRSLKRRSQTDRMTLGANASTGR